MKTILVTGSAGFIGSNLVLRLLSEARACSHSEESKQASLSSRSNAAFKEMSVGTIVGLDNLNDYYDPTLKDYRLSEIEKPKPAGIGYEFVKGDFDFEAHKKLVPMQSGDVPTTYADATALERDFGFTPKITLREGLRKFAEWYASFYMSKD